MAPSEAIGVIREFLAKCQDMPVVAPVDFEVWEALDKLTDCAGMYEARFDCYECEECGERFNTPEQREEHQHIAHTELP